MMKINWYLFLIVFIVWVVVGFMVFDNIAAKLIYMVSGGIGSFIFATEKKKPCN